ncbi:MAG: sigma 54-interacting transcriptional regulator [Lysobacteraceae bacterium]
MPFHLICELDEQRRRFHVGDGEYLIGSAADCDLRLPFPTVSRHHARLHVDGNAVDLEDMGSSNGTLVDGQRLSHRQRLEDGAQVQFGTVSARLQPVDAGESSLAVAINMSAHSRAPDGDQTLPVTRAENLSAEVWDALIAAAASGASAPAVASYMGDALITAGLATAIEIVDSADSDDARVLLRHGDTAATAQLLQIEHGSLSLRASGGRLEPALLQALLRLLELGRRQALPADDVTDETAVDGDTPALADPRMREIYQRARRVASSDLNVLIRGESGTGKEVLAQFIRQHDGKRDAPYVALNCAALADDLIDAELFGIERGVATGVNARPGKFEQANGGILFLDEIGDMAPSTQARLLRVLQEGEVTRIGGSQPRPARARVIAATNQDLDQAVADGRFRLDLLHRIADWQVTLPPLRERPQDIPLLAGRFLEQACRARGIRVSGITRAAHAALLGHDWPGNVRELQREMARAAVFLGNGDALSRVDLGLSLQQEQGDAGTDLNAQLQAAERRILRTAITAAAGNISEAASRLGIARSTLYRRMEALGIDPRGSNAD